MQVLFVCTGNTCRSPMAAALLKHEVAGTKMEISSAGINAYSGDKASLGSQKAMEKRGLDLTGHIAKKIVMQDLLASDLILTMTQSQADYLKRQYPEGVEKILTLKEYVGEEGDVSDPYGGSLTVYEETAGEIERLIKKVASLIKRKMKMELVVALGSDHGGYELKEEIKKFFEEKGIKYKDFGCYNTESVDYPDIAFAVAGSVAKGEYAQGILVCGTGIGMSIAANKVPGIRAALVGDVFSAKMSREHNNSNILVLGGRVTGKGLALLIVETYLATEFAGGRHATRLGKIAERENC